MMYVARMICSRAYGFTIHIHRIQMTAGELIEILSKLKPDTQIGVHTGYHTQAIATASMHSVRGFTDTTTVIGRPEPISTIPNLAQFQYNLLRPILVLNRDERRGYAIYPSDVYGGPRLV